MVFTQVLDHVTLATDEEGEAAEPTDRAYWSTKKGTEATLALADRLHRLAAAVDPGVELNYNKHYISLARNGEAKNFLIMRPRKKSLIAEFRRPQDDERHETHEALGFDVLPYDKRFNNYRLRLTREDLEDRSDALRDLADQAERHYRTG